MITLATLADATPMEVFQQAKEHLLRQGRKSVGNRKESPLACLYRSGDLKCAAGCFISDDEYDSEMEGSSWGSLVVKGFAPIKHKDLIEALQEIHDGNEPRYWLSRLAKLEEKVKSGEYE